MRKTLLGKAVWFIRVSLGLHPDVPANDTGTALFIGAVLFSALLSAMLVKATLGGVFIAYYLSLIVSFYAIAISFYSYWRRMYYRSIVRMAAAAKTNGGTVGLWRYGEHVGAAVVTLMLLLPVLVAFHVSLPFGMGVFTENRAESFITADLTVGILSAFSISKIFDVPSRPRTAHNTVLLLLCVISTVTMMTLVLEEARGGAPVPDGSLWTYSAILVSYAAHNSFLSILCPTYHQRRLGHLAGLSVAFFTAAVCFAIGIGLLPVLPVLLFGFFGITWLVFVVSGTFKYVLEEPIVRWFLGRKDNDANSDSAE